MTMLEHATRGAAGRHDSTDNPLERDFSDKELRKYSLIRALRLMSQRKTIDGFEGEVSDHIAKKSGKDTEGFLVPTRWLATRLFEQRRRRLAAAVTTSTGSGGILTQVSGNYIDALRPMLVSSKLGVTILGGLQGNFGIPRTSGLSAYWCVEGTAPTDGAMTIDQATLSVKTIGARTDFSRGFLKQTSLDCEDLAAEALTKTIAGGIDQGLAQGSGTSGQPLGILNDTRSQILIASGTASTTGPAPENLTGSTLTHANILAMQTNVANANVFLDTAGAYLFNPWAAGKLKSMSRGGTGLFVWGDADEVWGYPAFASNILPAANGTNSGVGTSIFGAWDQAAIGQWGTLEITVDPWALSSSGGLRVIALQDVDIELLQPQAFIRVFGISGTT